MCDLWKFYIRTGIAKLPDFEIKCRFTLFKFNHHLLRNISLGNVHSHHSVSLTPYEHHGTLFFLKTNTAYDFVWMSSMASKRRTRHVHFILFILMKMGVGCKGERVASWTKIWSPVTIPEMKVWLSLATNETQATGQDVPESDRGSGAGGTNFQATRCLLRFSVRTLLEPTPDPSVRGSW